MRTLQLALTTALLFTAITTAQTVYTWVDDDGTRHFSDSQSENTASAITLPQHEPLTAPSHQEGETLTPYQQDIEQQHASSSPPAVTTPLEINITAPEPDSAVRSNNGSLQVKATLNRKLAPNEQLQLIVNGVSYGALKTQPNWQLESFERGQHSLSIQAFRDGKLIASSQPITVHLLRATIKSVKPSPNS
ncbi:DUF4124 domain-containing protein [Vibrio europaeus]|uniref:DUF4124 domain-containing protein n=1 Tax=Vibrio europaeus TaxID=300876 RepID=A0A178J9J8_9VIBR|nr:DUF4124 domain-containing protein [Vibrio europaeus]MDC5703187.1 DUF4124 domain-containing protein [Vibrio europaeus]MDC5708581.1 DUF4124 domain-containing protein [Vibrio europaeus]MDC5713079.1 DUF4124 domain-containing protein [Vibrio europaeus]MDC5718092.1 DUF4124 domain-containing protein [Vibrio europaeus]MDC5725499.1 DUF4124 domain-containing protein [Vibrio europaeus]